MKKKIKILASAIVGVLVVNIMLVMLQGVSVNYWAKLGYPSAMEIFKCNIDNYPGHSLECIRFPEKLMKNQKTNETLEYTKEGTGIDTNGYQVHIGDSREHVKTQFMYVDPDGDGSEYELGCYFCDMGYFLLFHFQYDENDVLKKINIQKNHYR